MEGPTKSLRGASLEERGRLTSGTVVLLLVRSIATIYVHVESYHEMDSMFFLFEEEEGTRIKCTNGVALRIFRGPSTVGPTVRSPEEEEGENRGSGCM